MLKSCPLLSALLLLLLLGTPSISVAADVHVAVWCGAGMIVDPDPALVILGDQLDWNVSASCGYPGVVCPNGATHFEVVIPICTIFPEGWMSGRIPITGTTRKACIYQGAKPGDEVKYTINLYQTVNAPTPCYSLDPYIKVKVQMPTSSTYGLIILLLTLIAIGTWALNRRRLAF